MSIEAPKQLMQSSECKYDIILPLVCELLSYLYAKFLSLYIYISSSNTVSGYQLFYFFGFK